MFIGSKEVHAAGQNQKALGREAAENPKRSVFIWVAWLGYQTKQ